MVIYENQAFPTSTMIHFTAKIHSLNVSRFFEKNAFLLIHFYLNSLEVFFHVNISLVNFVHRKAVRAAIFLLPLLGIANLIFLFFHQFDEAWKYALWSYTAHFFASFQGFFVAVLYCFLNGEVGY